MGGERWWTIRELADRYGCSVPTMRGIVYAARAAGEVHPAKWGPLKVRDSELPALEAFREQQAHGDGPKPQPKPRRQGRRYVPQILK